MPKPAEPSAEPRDLAVETRAIQAFMRGHSLEASRPDTGDVAALEGVLAPASAIYLTAVPSRPLDDLVAAAGVVRAAGFEPVAHLPARGLPSREALQGLLARLRDAADVRRVLVVGGDYERALGPYAGAADLIDSGELQQHGIEEVGLAAYPEGHPRIADYELTRLLAAKAEGAQATGLRVHIVTQFGFDAAATIGWLERLRQDGMDLPVKVGMAGPTGPAALLRYARRCGVAASAQALARHAGLARNLFAAAAPDDMLRLLAAACAEGRLGQVAPHFYSFGGLGPTARWAAAVAAGHLDFDQSGGFRAVP